MALQATRRAPLRRSSRRPRVHHPAPDRPLRGRSPARSRIGPPDEHHPPPPLHLEGALAAESQPPVEALHRLEVVEDPGLDRGGARRPEILDGALEQEIAQAESLEG